MPDVLLAQQTCHVEFGVALAVCVFNSICMFQWVLRAFHSLFIHAGGVGVESRPVSCDV